MSHTSKATTKVTEEHFDQEGNLFKRVVTETVDEFEDLDPDEKTEDAKEDDGGEKRPFDPSEYKFPTIRPITPQPLRNPPSLPKGWEVYCINGIEPCPAHSNYPGRSAG